MDIILFQMVSISFHACRKVNREELVKRSIEETECKIRISQINSHICHEITWWTSASLSGNMEWEYGDNNTFQGYFVKKAQIKYL